MVSPAVALKFAVVFENAFVLFNLGFDVAEVFVNEAGKVESINYIENAFTRDTAFSRKHK